MALGGFGLVCSSMRPRRLTCCVVSDDGCTAFGFCVWRYPQLEFVAMEDPSIGSLFQ